MARPRLPEEVREQRRRTGAAIREARERRGLTGTELARLLDISRPYVANIEAGRVALTDDMATRLARALRTSKAALIDAEVAA